MLTYHEDALSALRMLSGSGDQAVTDVYQWVVQDQQQQSQGDPLTILEHTTLAYMLHRQDLRWYPEPDILRQKIKVALAACRVHCLAHDEGGWRAGSGCPQAAEAAAVIGEGDDEPLGGDFLATTKVEAGKSDGALDDAEDRFDGLFAFFVAGFAFFAFEFRLHRQAPGFPDAALGFRFGRRAEVVGPVRLGLGNGDQRLDVLGLQFGYRRAAGKAGIGQHRVRQADGVFHSQDG